MIRNQPKTF